ncbi:MAG: hypothetical protein ACLRZN_02360 [Dialister invisus]
MKNSTKIGMAIIAAASILGAAYVYAFTGVVEEKQLWRERLYPSSNRELP